MLCYRGSLFLSATRWVGRRVPPLHGEDIVTGSAEFGFDKAIAGMLHGRIKRSTLPHAEILRIDTSKAETMPGVRAIVTAKDAPETLHGSITVGIRDVPTIARDRVRYIGEPIAAVAADSQEEAEDALEAIDVEYRELPAIFDPLEAIRTDSKVVLHPNIENYELQQMPPFLVSIDPRRPNVCGHLKIRHGDFDKALKNADVVVSSRFTTQSQHHIMTEPIATLAEWQPDGLVTIWTSVQNVGLREIIAQSLGLAKDRVRVIIPRHIGGGFGNRGALHLEAISALLSKKAGRPVRIALSREEMFMGTVVRHPAIIDIRDGVMRDGRIVVREVTAVFDGGAYSTQGEAIVRNSGIATVPTYDIPNLKVDTYRVYTNRVPAGAMRGYAGPQMDWAIETQMDIVAQRLKVDPVEIRMKNLLKEGSVNAIGETMHAINIEECLRRVTEAVEWGKRTEGEGAWRRGKGIAVADKWSHANHRNVAHVKMRRDGVVEVWSSIVDIGQGGPTVMAQIAAEELGVPISQVKIVPVDTQVSPPSTGAGGSRQTFGTGNAVLLACRDLKKSIAGRASEMLGVKAEELDVAGGYVFSHGNSEEKISVNDLGLEDLAGVGEFYQQSGVLDPETGRCSTDMAVSHYTSAAVAAEVTVNMGTGQVRVLRIASAVDTGRAINPLMVEGQIQGGAAQGLGFALMEELLVDEGNVVTTDFKDYKYPSSLDCPTIEPIIVETPHKYGPYGAKGCGEASIAAVAPAITNAICDAVQVRIVDLPATPENVLRLLRRHKR